LAAAIGSPDAYSGEVPVAYVQLRPGQVCSAEELEAFAHLNISERAAVPKRIEILEALPLTAVGKIFKPALQQREIAKVVQQEVERLGLSNITVEVVQDNRRGHVACIRAGTDQEILAPLLGRYSFQVEWIN
jgi:fatty-acyl-CoA synthase